jgi:precorrin-6B methylase 2
MGFNSSGEVLEWHASLLADSVRTERYRQAIDATVKHGDVVIDLGCGTGILTLFACRAGARRVYAIEAGEVIELARRLSAVNGFEDQVRFVPEVSTRAQLPERTDVLVTETLGNFGLGERMLGSVIDARRRFLKKGGTIVPTRVDLKVSPVECPAAYESFDVWRNGLYGIDLSLARSHAVNNVYAWRFEPAHLLAEPLTLSRIELSRADEVDVLGRLSFNVRRAGVVHGIAGWFQAELAPGLYLSNSPPNVAPNWAHAFFPLERSLRVGQGDRVAVALRSLNEGTVWRWQVDVTHQSTGELVRFDQSTPRGYLLSERDLAMARPGYAPRLSRFGEAVLFVLSATDGSRSIGAIADEVARRYRDVLPSSHYAGRFVRRVVAKYG